MRRWGVALALALAGGAATEAASRFIGARFPDRPWAPDLLHSLLPHVPAASYITLGALALALALFAVYCADHGRECMPEFIALVAVMYLLRAGISVLTPLAVARNHAVLSFPLFGNVLFPSGHTALAYLLTRLTDRTRAPGLHATQIALLGVIIVTMLLSRGHYSIDIAGGLLLGYFVQHEWESGRLFGPIKRLVVAEALPEAA